ncbi:MAG: RNA methyltransferase [Thermoanaerobaculia bacterium]
MPLVAVLVRTHSPGNLGAAARAAKNFGAELILIDPKVDPLHPDAVAYASGAEEMLRRKDLSTDWCALREGVSSIVALSSLRGRVTRGLPPATTFAAIRRDLRAGRRVALVFGPERSGLSTEELRECDARIRIPTSPSFPSLNLAQAVAIALAFSLSLPVSIPLEAPRRRRGRVSLEEVTATSKELSFLKISLRSALAAAGYAGLGRNAHVVAELESSLLRAGLTAREVALWLGALAALGRPRADQRQKTR